MVRTYSPKGLTKNAVAARDFDLERDLMVLLQREATSLQTAGSGNRVEAVIGKTLPRALGVPPERVLLTLAYLNRYGFLKRVRVVSQGAHIDAYALTARGVARANAKEPAPPTPSRVQRSVLLSEAEEAARRVAYRENCCDKHAAEALQLGLSTFKAWRFLRDLAPKPCQATSVARPRVAAATA